MAAAVAAPPPAEQQLALEWSAVLTAGLERCAEARPVEFHELVRRGVPQHLRWQVWRAALGLERRIWANTYEELARRETAWAAQIRVDVGRTFPLLPSCDHAWQQRLGRVLTAFAASKPSVGYVQGMNLVAGMLLLVSGCEVEAFRAFIRLTDREDLDDFYREGFPALQRYRRMCLMHIKEEMPDLHAHFIRVQFRHPQYLDPWLLSLLIRALPLDLVKLAWDAMICEGLPNIVPIIVTSLRLWKPMLLNLDVDELSEFFRSMRDCEGAGGFSKIARKQITRSIVHRMDCDSFDFDDERLDDPAYDFDDEVIPAEKPREAVAVVSQEDGKLWPGCNTYMALEYTALSLVAATVTVMFTGMPHAGAVAVQTAGVPLLPTLVAPSLVRGHLSAFATRLSAPFLEAFEDVAAAVRACSAQG